MSKLLLFILGSTLLICTRCSSVETGELELKEPIPARIILYESIDSIKVGMSPNEVVKLLGEDYSHHIGDCACFVYGYGDGHTTAEPTEIELLFAEKYDDHLLWMRVQSPYDGKTKNGIGIGSKKQILRQLLGKPDLQEIQTSWGTLGLSNQLFRGDVYLAGESTAFVFGYDESDSVEWIYMFRIAV